MQAGVECLTQLVLLIEAMSVSKEPEAEAVSEVLQVQIVYNGEVLDIALDSLKVYKEGTQSLAYLDSSVHLAYALLRVLERHVKKEGEAGMVRQKKKRSESFWGYMLIRSPDCVLAKRKKTTDGSVPDEEEEIEVEEEEELTETMFTFDAFEQVCVYANLSSSRIHLTFLSPRYRGLPTQMSHKRSLSISLGTRSFPLPRT